MRMDESEMEFYTCAVVQHDGISQKIEWTQLHALCSELSIESIILSKCEKNGEVSLPSNISEVAGILLINCDDNYSLDKRAVQKCQMYTKSIFAVTMSDGISISKMMRSSKTMEVKVHLGDEGTYILLYPFLHYILTCMHRRAIVVGLFSVCQCACK